jgi:SAM-dependent methyltransferase
MITQIKHIINNIKSIDETFPVQVHHNKIIDDEDFKGIILDIGACCHEFDIVAKLRHPEIDITALEYNPVYAYVGACLAINSNAIVNTILGNILNTKFEDDSFDTIVLSNVIEHCEDIDKLLDILYSILKPNGTIFIALPYENCHDDPDHKHYFTIGDDKEIESQFNGKKTCINMKKFLESNPFEFDIDLFDEEKEDTRNPPPYKSRGQLDFLIKLKKVKK